MNVFLEPTRNDLSFNPRPSVPISNHKPVDVMTIPEQCSSLQDGLERLSGADIPGKHHAKAFGHFLALRSICFDSHRTITILGPVRKIFDARHISAHRYNMRHKTF